MIQRLYRVRVGKSYFPVIMHANVLHINGINSIKYSLCAGVSMRWRSTPRSKSSLWKSASSWHCDLKLICQSVSLQLLSVDSCYMLYSLTKENLLFLFLFNLDVFISSKAIHHLSIFTNIKIYISMLLKYICFM